MPNDSGGLKRAVSSLLFFVFGIDEEDLAEDSRVLDAMIGKAYVDAASRMALVTEPGDKDETRDRGTDYIAERAALLAEVDSFDDWHRETCEGLIKNHFGQGFKGGEFSYGNAQKWVNMTLKYADMLFLLFDLFGIEKPYWATAIEGHHSSLHVPVDSCIIEAVWKWDDAKLPGKGKLERRLGGYEKDSCGPYSASRVTCWSDWGKGSVQGDERADYERFQADLRGRLLEEIPCDAILFEWEAGEWIRVRKERDAKERARKIGREEL